MKESARVYVAGHRGLVGSALLRRLEAQGFTHLITRNHNELDLEDAGAVEAFFAHAKPENVFLAAARVGGILANATYPVDFLLRNLKIQNNVIEASWRHGVKALLALGSSCIYPKHADQPIREEYLLTGPLEPTNEPYAIAKIAGVALTEAFNRQHGARFVCAMPTNLYGPNDRYDLEASHVLPALIRKFHLAKLAVAGDGEEIQRDQSRYGPIPAGVMADLVALARAHGHRLAADTVGEAPGRPAVTLWGSGQPRREFLYSDDLADACIFVLRHLDQVFSTALSAPGVRPLINIGSGEDLTVRQLAELIADIVGFSGQLAWDAAKPDGTPRKLLDSTRIRSLGWKPRVTLEAGIKLAYADYLTHR